MEMIEISKRRFEELERCESEYYLNKKLFKNLGKDQQELLLKLEKYESALRVIAWSSDVNPLAALHAARARKALYK